MAITDLTNTKWQINTGWSATAGYGQFSINGITDASTNYSYEITGTFDIGYTIIYDETPKIVPNSGVIGFWASTGNYKQYQPNDSFTLDITGGTDTTNTNLISWLETNATQIKDTITQLAPFLTNIANAIRTKKGTTAPINAQNFASEIASIETGGGLVGYSGTVNWSPYHISSNIDCIVQLIKSDLSVETIKYTAEKDTTTTISTPVILIAYTFYAGLPDTSATNGALYDNFMGVLTSVNNGVFVPSANGFSLSLSDIE